MMPCVYSEKNTVASGNGWYRAGTNIRYFATPLKLKKKVEDPQYTLSFKIKFDHDEDRVWLSHCYPYTYSDLVEFLNKNCQPKLTKDRLKRTQICRSIAGNSLEMLIITNLQSS
jgi:cytosolic carboxypeptidase protein 2/3